MSKTRGLLDLPCTLPILPGAGTQRRQVGESRRVPDVAEAEESRDVSCLRRVAYRKLRDYLPGADPTGTNRTASHNRATEWLRTKLAAYVMTAVRAHHGRNEDARMPSEGRYKQKRMSSYDAWS